MGRLVKHPFSVGCVSQASVVVIENQPKKDQNEPELVCEGNSVFQVFSSLPELVCEGNSVSTFSYLSILLIMITWVRRVQIPWSLISIFPHRKGLNCCFSFAVLATHARFSPLSFFSMKEMGATKNSTVEGQGVHLVYKADDDDEYVEMEIGYPTEVQHVAHIGLDGFNNHSDMKSWDKAREFLPLSSRSLKQFQLALASPAESNANEMGSGPL